MDNGSRAALLLLYRRIDLLEETLNACKVARIRRLYVSIDGPANAKDSVLQEEIRDLLGKHERHFNIFEVRSLKDNQGIGVAIITALDWFFSQEESGVIIEDDIRVSLDFFDYVFSGLNKFVNEKNIWMISGTQPFSDVLGSNEVVWTSYPTIWGWGSWRDRWTEMRASIFTTPVPRKGMQMRVKNFWNVGAKRVLSGKVDTWDTPLAAASTFLPRYCALPPRNLVSNIGYGALSTNTKTSSFPMNLPIQNLPNSYVWTEISPPDVDFIDELFIRRVYDVSWKHSILPAYSNSLDWWRYRRQKKLPLEARLKLFIEHEIVEN